MNDNETRRHQTFRRVGDFGQTHGDDFSPDSIGKQLFTKLGAIITELNGHAASEASARGQSRQGTETRAQTRDGLREDLEDITRTARAMADDVPGLEDKFRLPRGNNDQQLLNAARAFLADATPLKTHFIAHELSADFLEDLQHDIDGLIAAISGQAGGVGNHAAAGAAIDDAIDRGADTVRKLDAIVRNKYAHNPAVLAEWTSVSHTERAPRRASGGGSTPTPPAPATA